MSSNVKILLTLKVKFIRINIDVQIPYYTKTGLFGFQASSALVKVCTLP